MAAGGSRTAVRSSPYRGALFALFCAMLLVFEVGISGGARGAPPEGHGRPTPTPADNTVQTSDAGPGDGQQAPPPSNDPGTPGSESNSGGGNDGGDEPESAAPSDPGGSPPSSTAPDQRGSDPAPSGDGPPEPSSGDTQSATASPDQQLTPDAQGGNGNGPPPCPDPAPGGGGDQSCGVGPPGPLASITISPSSATIAAGTTQSYTASGFDASGRPLGDVTSATTFSIDGGGSCSGSSCGASTPGSYTVTGTNGSFSDTAALQVVAGTLDHIVISPSSATIPAGGSQSYTAEGFDSANNSLGDVTGATAFSISTGGSCTLNACGSTTPGTYTVTGTHSSGPSDTASLQVNAGALDSITIAPQTATVPAGGSQAYTATGFDQFGNSLGDVTSGTTFSITNGSCTGASCGATAAGDHTVTGNNGGKTDTATLTVSPTALTTITISPSSGSIAAGDTQTYSAQGFDTNGNPLGDVTSSTVFVIAPDGSCTTNSCTATTAGPHTVTGTSGAASDDAALTVNPGPLDHLVLSPGTTTFAAGQSQTYTADGYDQYGNFIGDQTSNTTFSISPDGSCAGNVCTASTPGPHTVTGSAPAGGGTATGTAAATVQGSSNNPPPDNSPSNDGPPAANPSTNNPPASTNGLPVPLPAPATTNANGQPLSACPASTRSHGAPPLLPFALVPASMSLEEEFRRRRGDGGDDGTTTTRRRSRRIRISVAAVVLVLAAILVPLYMRGSGGDRGAKLGIVTGIVDVSKDHRPFTPGAVGQELSAGDVVRTGATGHARIDYPDGSLTRLDTDTTFAIRDINVEKNKKAVKLRLDKGRVWNRVQKLTNPGDRYEVKTVTAVATVQGTGFLDDTAGRGCKLIVAEGVVDDTTNGGDSDDVNAGQGRTDDGQAISHCSPTAEQIQFMKASIEADAAEKGWPLIDLAGFTGGNPPAAQSNAPQALGTNACQTAVEKHGGSNVPAAVVAALGALAFLGTRRRRITATNVGGRLGWTEADTLPPAHIETDTRRRSTD